MDDLKNIPPKELDINLDSLATQSKNLDIMKNLINNDELTSIILNIYNDKENLTLPQRRNISNIFYNLLKNTFNVENILEKKPEIIKSIIDKAVKKENVIKDVDNIDIPQKELQAISSMLKDKNNSTQLIEKNLISPDNISEIINNYKDVHESLNDSLNQLQNILDILTNKKGKEDNYKLDKAILNNLREKIKKAFDEHLNELKKLNTDEFNNAISDDMNINLRTTLLNKNNINNNNLLESTSNMKKRRLSIISHHLFYDPYNNQICSPISLKSHEDMSTSLDSLLSLIRLVYSNNKDFKDKDIQEQRISLLKEALETLKMFTICPENHKTLEEAGLLNFMEKLEHDEDFPIYLSSLDVIKNCTWSENAVLSLIETKLFDQIIDEVIKFYNNPELLSENDDNKICFFYDNIILTNISKVNKGFEAIYNKIGIEKLLKICKNTGNLYFLTSCVMVLNNYIENAKLSNNEFNFNKPELIGDILEICQKGFNSNINELNENLFFKTMKLIGNIYNENSMNYIAQMDIVQIINLTFDRYKDEPEYFFNVNFILKIVCVYHKHYSDEIVDLKLIHRIAVQIMLMEQKDDLVTNYSTLLNNLLETNEDNRNKLCLEEIINNVLNFIDKYSPKLDNNNKQNKIKEILSSRSTMANMNNNLTIFENNASKENENLNETYNLILNNFLKVLYYLSLYEKSIPFINNNKYLDSVLHILDRKNMDINNITISLLCLVKYYSRINKDLWKKEYIEEIYTSLHSLQITYYTSGDLLIHINNLISFIIKGLEDDITIEKYYALALEGLNCQDWNEKLVLLTLDIIRQCLYQHENLRNDVFEITKNSILNILRLFPNNLIIQIIGYEILVLFTEKGTYAYELANTDIFSIIRTTLSNKDFDYDPEKRLNVRLNIYKLLNYLAFDKTINLKISFELMESFLKELMTDYFTEDLNEMSYLLVTLFKTKLSIEPFLQYSGLNVLSLCFQKFYEQKKFILNCFSMLKEICFSSEENKDKLQILKMQEKVQMVIDNSKPEEKKIKLEGKILIYNINYDKNNKPKSTYSPPLNLIEKEKMIKNFIYNFMVKGISVKASNPKGKIKDFILAFSPDLMKIYLKKPKTDIIPPKAKYTLETPLINEIIRNYEIINFKKSGLHTKPPEKQLCFAILQNLLEGQKAPKKLIIICSNPIECYQISGCVEIIVDYIKTKCEKQHVCKIDDMQSLFLSIMQNQPQETPSKRKRTILLRGKFK